jgi:transcriptional regulator with XRE-family HTH domain
MKENEEKEGIISRFVELRQKYGPSQAKFGELLGVSHAAISLIEKGKTQISDRHIKLISSVLGISEDWLRTGTGSMFKDGKVPDEDTMLKMYCALSEDGRKMVMDYIKLILKNEKVMRGEIEKGETGIGPGDSGETG